jgi:hypothetical protein
VIFAKLDVDFTSNPKLARLGDAIAELLHLRAIAYSRKYLTDGYIAAAALGDISPRIASTKRRAQALVTSGLWHRVAGGQLVDECEKCALAYADITIPDQPGWVIHDYLEYQEPAEEIRQRLAASSERARNAARARWDKPDASEHAPRMRQAALAAMPESESDDKNDLTVQEDLDGTDPVLVGLLHSMGEAEHSQAHLELLAFRARGAAEFDFRQVAAAVEKRRPAKPRAYVVAALANRLRERVGGPA